MRYNLSKIVFIFCFAFVLETICGFAHVSLFSQKSYAQSDTIYFAQAVRVCFPKGSWYCDHLFETGGMFDHPGYSKISLSIEAGKVQTWKMSMDNLIRSNLEPDRYTFSISNGKLLGMRILETTDTGVAELKADAAVMKKISSTPLYKKLVEISLRPLNEEGDFVRY